MYNYFHLTAFDRRHDFDSISLDQDTDFSFQKENRFKKTAVAELGTFFNTKCVTQAKRFRVIETFDDFSLFQAFWQIILVFEFC